jgi:hypothetical protein
MKFQMPESLEGLTLDKISELYAAAAAEAAELNAIPDDKITDEQTAELIELAGHLGTLSDRREELDSEAKAKSDALAAARAAIASASEPAEEEQEEEPAEEVEEPAEEVEEKELVASGAGKTRKPASFASKVASKKKPEPEPEEEPEGGHSIIAAANVADFNSGQELQGLDELAKAYVGRGKMFANSKTSKGKGLIRQPGVYGLSPEAQRFSVAKLHKAMNEFTIDESMSAEAQYDMIMRASREARLGGGSLVAAGGWCAPSERIWGFLELETADGLLSIPELIARRGGIEFTKGPDLAGLLADANFGWVMTEAEVEAGEDEKPCFEIACPDWDEVRLDAVGFCIRAGLLTNSAYPELIRRYLGLGLIAHARKMNAATISRLRSMITLTSAFAAVGAAGTQATTSDILDAIELNALRIREMYSMSLNATMEAVFPLWALPFIRSDLSRRNNGGLENLNITDAQVKSWFALRGINAQFVRDYLPINSGAANTAGGTANWTTYPQSMEFMLYPAGSYVRLGTDVIDLDTVYDTDGLKANTYTAAFFEEGFALANTGGQGVKVTVTLGNRFGATGYPSVGAVAGVAFAPAA